MPTKGVPRGQEIVLAGELFTPAERWGWEYLVPPPPVRECQDFRGRIDDRFD